MHYTCQWCRHEIIYLVVGSQCLIYIAYYLELLIVLWPEYQGTTVVRVAIVPWGGARLSIRDEYHGSLRIRGGYIGIYWNRKTKV